MPKFSEFTATTLSGDEQPMSSFAGEVVLVVNTASKCGFTPQFEGLQELHEKYGEQGLSVLGFPCDQFANQEFADAEKIGDFCQKNYGVTFPMFAKVDVNGKDAHPLFRWLRKEKPGSVGDKIRWNFTKFLVARDGTVLARYGSTTTPAKIAKDIEKAL
jgi:glutathione peroxidase